MTTDQLSSLATIERQIPKGQYDVVNGDSEITAFHPARLTLKLNETEGPLPGVSYRGKYREQDVSGNELDLPVISFLYHKQDGEGNLETEERAVIWRGIGYGEHEGHTGQGYAWYLTGPQIGTFDTQTGNIVGVPEKPSDIKPKHFSIACISGGPLGEAVLANPRQETGRHILNLVDLETSAKPESLTYPVGFFDAQVKFAQKWAEITGEDFTEVLLRKTSLYRRLFNEKPPTDRIPHEWFSAIEAIDQAATSGDVTQAVYDMYAEAQHSVYTPPEDGKGFGYDYNPETRTVKIHFDNPVRGESPFSEANMPKTREEFKRLLDEVLANHPEAETLLSASWIRSLTGYRSLSPPDIAEQEDLMSPDMSFGGASVWGQFIDKFGQTNERVYGQFVEAVHKAETVKDLLEAFPYKVLRAQDPIERYYHFYGIY